jgi:hypothetical protein
MTASQRDDGSLFGPTIKTVVFTVVMPGSVIGLIPFLLSRWEIRAPLLGSVAVRWAGIAPFLSPVPLFIEFLVRSVREGRGTPAPIAPTRLSPHTRSPICRKHASASCALSSS